MFTICSSQRSPTYTHFCEAIFPSTTYLWLLFSLTYALLCTLSNNIHILVHVICSESCIAKFRECEFWWMVHVYFLGRAKLSKFAVKFWAEFLPSPNWTPLTPIKNSIHFQNSYFPMFSYFALEILSCRVLIFWGGLGYLYLQCDPMSTQKCAWVQWELLPG